MKKIILASIVVICCAHVVFAQSITTKYLSSERESPSANTNSFVISVPPAFFSILPVTSGAVLGLTGYYDSSPCKNPNYYLYYNIKLI